VLAASPLSSQDTVTSENVSQPTSIAATPSDSESLSYQSEPSSALGLSFGHGSGSSTIDGSQTDSEASFYTASLSDPDLPPSPASMGPAAQVDYNPKIKRTLNLSVVQTLNFTAPVACVKFSQDGKYFAVATDFDKTHIYNVVTMSTG
jgi:glucose repression regulatory protein TUP1